MPGLGSDFRVKALHHARGLETSATTNSFKISPGSYLLIEQGKSPKTQYPGWDNERLTKYIAPKTDIDQTWLMHTAYAEISTDDSNPVLQAEIISKDSIETVEAWFQNGNTYSTSSFEHQKGYTYQANIPEELLHQGYLDYRIIVTSASGSSTYPSGKAGNPGDCDYEVEDSYTSRVVDSDKPIYLFQALEDAATVVGEWNSGNRLFPTSNPAEPEYQVQLEELFTQDPENLDAAPIIDYSFRSYFADKIAARQQDLQDKRTLVLKARSLVGESRPLQVALVMKDGTSFGTTIELEPDMQEYQIALSELEPVSTVTLPRPYPTFLPYYLDHNQQTNFDLTQAESLQFSIGPGLSVEQQEQPQGVAIISLYLQ